MSDVDPRLRERFAAYRNDVTTRVAGPGPDQARRTLRRRRRTAMVAAAAAAVVLVAAPVVANATLNGERPKPVPGQSIDPTAPPTSAPSPTPSATGSPSATATATAGPEAPDGRISRAQLLAARVDLPDWPSLVPKSCTTSDVRLRSSATDFVPVLADAELGHGDVDGDGATETVALVACRYGEASAKQVVAFDRDSQGRIVTLGRVVRTNDGFDDILGLEVSPAGSVQVRVADIQPCCRTPRYWVRDQVRTYRWNGDRFVQTDGPTTFGKDPRLTDLKLSMTYKLGAFIDNDTRQYLTTVLTVTNAGPRDAEQISFYGLDVGDEAGGDWAKCNPSPAAEADNPACLLPGVPAGETRQYTFVHLVPGGARQEYMDPRYIIVSHCDGQDRQWRDLAQGNNRVTLPFPL
ncbi:hypothetical protein GA0074696_1240 [Micromonospora purpureochromogenes]|uniref:Uncharacterized protein n=1 Tax=Micromonospora purpureochromogenes TaxID=47872 RepID=A0A1C4VMW9_9ACTN|nr:hypothetical protein [Micromonospora purpureochromogenes]SCE85316.1 hypothetical protein GA0074696_1240 [Micromonospora purpureochromogenes]